METFTHVGALLHDVVSGICHTLDPGEVFIRPHGGINTIEELLDPGPHSYWPNGGGYNNDNTTKPQEPQMTMMEACHGTSNPEYANYYRRGHFNTDGSRKGW